MQCKFKLQSIWISLETINHLNYKKSENNEDANKFLGLKNLKCSHIFISANWFIRTL